MNHRRGSDVAHHYHIVAIIAIILPIWVVRHLRWSENWHRVIGTCSCHAAHTVTFCWSLTARQVCHLTRVVDHAAIEQELLLSQCQLIVVVDTPSVVLIETLESSIVGNEQGFATRLSQHLAVPQVVYQLHSVGVIAIILQIVIDAGAQPTWIFLSQVVALAR